MFSYLVLLITPPKPTSLVGKGGGRSNTSLKNLRSPGLGDSTLLGLLARVTAKTSMPVKAEMKIIGTAELVGEAPKRVGSTLSHSDDRLSKG